MNKYSQLPIEDDSPIKENTREKIKLEDRGNQSLPINAIFSRTTSQTEEETASKIEKFERRLDILEFSLILKSLRIEENIRLQSIVKDFTGVPHG